jgi:uncharacterized OsmC-like protein
MRFLNNIDLDRLQNTKERATISSSELVKKLSLTGEWRVNSELPPQFVSRVSYEGGSATIEAESPSFLGGRGTHPSPLQLCLAGLASCFLATFVSTCCEMGIRLRKARITAACEIDFNPVFGLREGPINRGVEFLVDAEAEGAVSLEEALKAAVERCPAVYSLRNAIPVKATLAG